MYCVCIDIKLIGVDGVVVCYGLHGLGFEPQWVQAVVY